MLSPDRSSSDSAEVTEKVETALLFLGEDVIHAIACELAITGGDCGDPAISSFVELG